MRVALGSVTPGDGRRAARLRRRRLSISYYSYGRDFSTDRVVDPLRLVSREGRWYLLAHCLTAEGERLFRVDRIRAAEVLATPAEAHPGPDDVVPGPHGGERTVELVTGSDARWVADTYPTDEVEELADGRLRIVLPANTTWLERLLLRLTPTGCDTATGAATGRRRGEGARRYER